jgi:hypothetical protein
MRRTTLHRVARLEAQTPVREIRCFRSLQLDDAAFEIGRAALGQGLASNYFLVSGSWNNWGQCQRTSLIIQNTKRFMSERLSLRELRTEWSNS